MIRFLSTVLLAMFAASFAHAAEGIGGTVQKRSDGYRIDLPSTKAAGTYVIGEAFPTAVVGFDLGSAFAGTLYACETNTYAAGTCTAFTTALSADFSNREFETSRRFYLLTIATPESGSNVSRLTIYGSFDIGGGGRGGDPDVDDDGLYEFAYLWDADGDGSVNETCTAANAVGAITEPACTVAGEIIYRDFSDDLNCAMHGCGYGQMEQAGSIYLLDSVNYVIWPCWDASRTGTYNDPSAANEAFHDTTADAAYQDCPASPDTTTTRRLGAIATLGWQGEIIGGGYDTRNPTVTSGYTRNKGTYIINDMGPTWDNGSGTSEDANSWWGQAGFVRGFNTGFSATHNSDLTAYINSGEDAGDFDSGGYATASGNQTVEAMDGVLCITQTNIGTPAAGDNVIVYGTSDRSASVDNVAALMRVMSYSTTDCNGAGTASITMGGAVSYVVGSTDYTAVPQALATDIPHIYRVTSGDLVTMARSDFLDPAVRISNVTFAPQDAWNDSTNACGATGTWTFAADVASTDFDCDTNPMIGLWGGGKVVIEDAVVRSHGAFAVDGESNVGNPMVRNVQFLYGNGGPIMDAGSGWVVRDVEIRDSMFNASALSLYGSGVTVDGLKVYNSNGSQLIRFDSQSTDEIVRNVELDSSAFTHAFAFTCGAVRNQLKNVTISNAKGFGLSYDQGLAVDLACADNTIPIQGNTFENFMVSGAGFGDDDGTGYSASKDIAVVKFDTNSTKASPKTDSIIRNRFEGFNYLFTESSASHAACMFAMLDENVGTRVTPAAGDFNLEQIFAHNVFYGNTIFNSGSGTDNMYCNCDLEDGSAPADPNSCADPILGAAANGVNARGCMNIEGAATISTSLQTCN